MSLQYYPTPHIEHKDDRSYLNRKQLLIGTFSVLEDEHDTGFYKIPTLTQGIVDQVSEILEKEDMQWVIEQSYGGLYLDVTKRIDPNRFEHTFGVSMIVYVSPEIYTFCHLKYSDNLTRMIK